jgi:hypothetical protein
MEILMTSIRKFAFAALLAATTFSLAPSLAKAEEPVRGKFTLTHDVRWGNAKVPAGDYEFTFHADGVSPLLTLTKISGTPAGYMVLVPSMGDIQTPAGSTLLLESTPEGSYVSAMNLPEFGMTLHFNVPNHSGRQMAKAATTAVASGQ